MEDVEEYEGNDEAHNLLLSSLSKLDKTQHIKVPTRKGATNLNTEFDLTKSSNKIDLKNVVKVLGSTGQHVEISKTLKKTQDASKVLPKPLEKPQAERLKRSTGYKQTKERVGRWDAVVSRNRTLDCVYFPLKQANNKLEVTDEFVTKFELKSPLELELDKVDPQPQVEEDEEDEPVYPMTYQEMVEQRKHLAKMRAQQSFKAAKEKRQKKIKSKKFHRILKKEKLRQQLKEFEELQKTDPEEALKKLDALEKERALERHTLRHKNTGKWAKSKLVRAKYDKDVRQQLAEQLSVARTLTKKVQDSESSDEENNDNIKDLTLSQDPMNPWMLQRPDKSNVDAEFNFGYKQYLKDKSLNRKADSESDSETDDVLDKPSLLKLRFTQNVDKSCEELSDNIKYVHSQQEGIIDHQTNKIHHKNMNNKIKDKNSKQPTNIVATTSWNVESNISITDDTENDKIVNCFDGLESAISQKVSEKLKVIRDEIEQRQVSQARIKTNKKPKQKAGVEYLEFKSKQKAIIDDQLEERTSKEIDENKRNEDLFKEATTPIVNNEVTPADNIDPSRFIQAKPKYLNTAVTDGDFDVDDLDDSEQVVPKVNIEDVFEDDDVVASFRQEKEDEANKDKPQDIDLSLPGWGQWGGKGVKPIKRKRNRFITKGAIKTPRRDENKGDIIIKEYKNPKLSAHKITEIPFPFKTVKDFEASIRTPLGNTFIPESSHRNLIKPSKITKAGAIIEPMDEDELLSSKNIHYRNENVMQMLAKSKRPIQQKK